MEEAYFECVRQMRAFADNTEGEKENGKIKPSQGNRRKKSGTKTISPCVKREFQFSNC